MQRTLRMVSAETRVRAHPGGRASRPPRSGGRIEDEGEALQLALGQGLTGTSAPRRNMGMGLGLLQDFSDRLGGDLWIASGAALLRRRTVAGVRSTTVHANGAWPGSWICLEARTTPS